MSKTATNYVLHDCFKHIHMKQFLATTNKLITGKAGVCIFIVIRKTDFEFHA